MLWVLKSTVSMRRFFWAPKTFRKLMGKKIFIILRSNILFIFTNDNAAVVIDTARLEELSPHWQHKRKTFLLTLNIWNILHGTASFYLPWLSRRHDHPPQEIHSHYTDPLIHPQAQTSLSVSISLTFSMILVTMYPWFSSDPNLVRHYCIYVELGACPGLENSWQILTKVFLPSHYSVQHQNLSELHLLFAMEK